MYKYSAEYNFDIHCTYIILQYFLVYEYEITAHVEAEGKLNESEANYSDIVKQYGE